MTQPTSRKEAELQYSMMEHHLSELRQWRLYYAIGASLPVTGWFLVTLSGCAEQGAYGLVLLFLLLAAGCPVLLFLKNALLQTIGAMISVFMSLGGWWLAYEVGGYTIFMGKTSFFLVAIGVALAFKLIHTEVGISKQKEKMEPLAKKLGRTLPS